MKLNSLQTTARSSAGAIAVFLSLPTVYAQKLAAPSDPVVAPSEQEVATYMTQLRAQSIERLKSDPDGWDDLQMLLVRAYDKDYKFNPADHVKDTDGDGKSDYEEMLVGSNPVVKEAPYSREQVIAQIRESRRQNIESRRKELADLMPKITKGLQRAAESKPLPDRVKEVDQRERDFKAEKERKLDLAEAFMNRHEARRDKAIRAITPEVRKILEVSDSPLMLTGISGGQLQLIGPDDYTAAVSVQTNALWPSGASTLPDVTGYSPISEKWRKIGIWEAGGGVLTNHLFFQFTPPLPAPQVSMSRVTQVDNPSAENLGGLFRNSLSAFNDHATIVAGVMASGSIYGPAQGMSYEGRLLAYGSGNDIAEMMGAAVSGMTLSNHSYSERFGWLLIGSTWYWLGRSTAGEDPRFGLYGAQSREIDLVANENENYLSVWSAGNEGAEAGPVLSTGLSNSAYIYQRLHDDDGDGILNVTGYQLSSTPHPQDSGVPLTGATIATGDAGSTATPIGLGFNTLKASAISKNNLVVGCVDDLPSGFTNGGSAAMSFFSSRGPTDDGRIKPDLVANGTTVVSPTYQVGAATAITNSSFELPSLGIGAEQVGATNWTSEPVNSTNVKTTRIASFSSDANQVIRINSSSTKIYQDVTGISLAANQQNVLTVSVGNLAGTTLSGNQSRLSVYTNGFATQLASVTVDASTLGKNQFTDISLSIPIGATVPAGTVRIVLENTGTGACFFDYVRWNNVLLTYYSTGQSGTSFSTPAVTGSMNLVQVLNDMMGGGPLRAVTWKTLFIHTADDPDRLPAFYANNDANSQNRLYPGPDYFYGWGLLNTRRAAEFLQKHLNTTTRRTHIQEHALFSGSVVDIPLTVPSGTPELRVSAGWNDPAYQNTTIAASDGGLLNVGPTDPANPTTSMLMNDLDIRLLRVDSNGTVLETRSPYKLDVSNPRNPATQGDNTVDNTEQVVVTNPVAGNWIARISHKGTNLKRLAKLLPGHAQYSATIPKFEVISGGAQKFALVVSGVIERPSDALKVSTITQASNATQSFNVLDWQSVKGLRYTAEKSPDLTTWSKVTNADVGITTNPTDTWLSAPANDGSETVTIAVPISEEKYFFRIQEAGL